MPPAPAPAIAPAQPVVSAPVPTAPGNGAKQEVKVEEKGPISLTVTRIGRGANQFVGDNYVSLASVLKNEGKKSIKAMKGAILVYDAFGEQLMRLSTETSKR
jgi:hypothetical protein